MNNSIESQIRIRSTQFNKLEEYLEVKGIVEKSGQTSDSLIRICKFPSQEYEGNYKAGRKEGWWTEWHENGQKRSEVNYQKVKTGAWRWMFETEPKYGKKEGQYITWHDNGQKREEGDFDNGKLKGRYINWYRNGQKKYEAYFSFGKVYGKRTQWYENGNIKSIDYCRADYCGGQISWHENGRPNVQGKRANNEVVGLWTWHDEDGNITQEVLFDDNGNRIWEKEY